MLFLQRPSKTHDRPTDSWIDIFTLYYIIDIIGLLICLWWLWKCTYCSHVVLGIAQIVHHIFSHSCFRFISDSLLLFFAPPFFLFSGFLSPYPSVSFPSFLNIFINITLLSFPHSLSASLLAAMCDAYYSVMLGHHTHTHSHVASGPVIVTTPRTKPTTDEYIKMGWNSI